MVCFVTFGMHSIFILSTDYTDNKICVICGFFNVSKPLHIKRYQKKMARALGGNKILKKLEYRQGMPCLYSSFQYLFDIMAKNGISYTIRGS